MKNIAGEGVRATQVLYFHIGMVDSRERGNPGEVRFRNNGVGKILLELLTGFWWGVRTLSWWLSWSRSVRVLALLLWFVFLCLVLVLRPPGALIVFGVVSAATAVLWFVPLLRVAYRLYRRVRPPVPAGWYRADAEIAKELRSDWMQQIRDLGFNLAGYLTKNRGDAPLVALFINSENRDSAHVSRVAGKHLLVFKTRFGDGFAFETGNAASAPLLPAIPSNPVFRFPQVDMPSDLYELHQRIRKQMGTEREPVISEDGGEIAEFISRAEVVRSHMMSRDYRLKPLANGYGFTIPGAIRHAALLTWPVKPIREAMFHRKALNELTKLGFQIDKKTGRIVGQ